MEKTKNYDLLKPGVDDFYDIGELNTNVDIIDQELKRVQESVGETSAELQDEIEALKSSKADLANGKVPEAQLPIGTALQKGIVQLSTSVSTGSSTTAATSGAVKQAYDLAHSKQAEIDRVERTILGMISNKNLLINWDFRNPVNQRGQSVYTAEYAADKIYTIDRWGYWSKKLSGKVELMPSGICVGGGIGHVEIHQKIDSKLGGQLCGKQITLSVDIESNADVNLYLYNTTSDTAPLRTTHPSGSGIIICTGVVPLDESDTWSFVVSTNNSEFVLYSAKLELGPVSTLANDPPAYYGEQLALCQRYFQRYPIVRGSTPVATPYIPVFITYPEMRSIPTVMIAGSIADGGGIPISDAKVEAVDFRKNCGNFVQLSLPLTNDVIFHDVQLDAEIY